MRYPPGHKERTRARILEAAGTVFRRLGYHAAGVDAVMAEAGLTAGGFYAHFASKDALLADTLAQVAAELAIRPEKQLARLRGRERLMAFVDRYLSPAHRRSKPEACCPLPLLVSEVARAEKPVKASFEAVVERLAGQIESDEAGRAVRDDRTLAVLALCVGGLALSRAVSDDALGDRILAACRQLASDSQGTGSARRN